MATYHLLVEGTVQGVFYRVSAKEMANELGVKGWVKNTPQGHVEIKVSGEEGAVKSFIAWCDSGPKNAKVNCVTVTPIDDEMFPDFKIMR